MTEHPIYQKCIDACLKCAAACNHCAAACTKEEDIKMMAACIRLDMECAVICYATAQLMSMGSSKSKNICSMCTDICEKCADECGKHAHEHCQICAALCRQCAEACRQMCGTV